MAVELGQRVPEPLLQSAWQLRAAGEKHGVAELTHAKHPLDPYDGHFWSILATGLCRAQAYYRGPYDGGSIFLLILDKDYPITVENPLQRLASLLPQALEAYPIVDHRRALAGHAASLGLKVAGDARCVDVTDSERGSLRATFDVRGRLTEIAGKTRP